MNTLSPRELQCVKLFAQGQSYKEVARTLGMKFTTVHTNALRVRKKLKANNLTHAVAILYQNGVLPCQQ